MSGVSASTDSSIFRTLFEKVNISFRTTNDKYEHLIVTDLGTGPHCLFVRDFNSTTSDFTCLNSWGPNNKPTPVVNSMDISHYYRVSAMASKLKLQQTSKATTISNSIATLTSNVTLTSPCISTTTVPSPTS